MWCTGKKHEAKYHECRSSCCALGAVLSLVFVLYLSCGTGSLVYNLYHLSALRHFHSLAVDNTIPLPSATGNLLHRAAGLGSKQAATDIAYFAERIGPDWPAADPLLHYLGSRGLIARRLGWELPDAVWDLAHHRDIRIEAEEMRIGGPQGNPEFVTRREQGGIEHVVLYWQHNHLTTLLMIPEPGEYRLTVRARDWPPVPLRLRIALGNHGEQLTWNTGDYAWSNQSVDLTLSRGLTSLSLLYCPPADNRTQNASIDYVTLEPVN